MQKSSFFKIVTIAIAATTIPIMAMEITHTKYFTVLLSLSKMTQQEMEEPLNITTEQNNKHACEVLKIPWKENNNHYKIDAACLFDNEQCWHWTHLHPTNLPLTKLDNPNYILKNTVFFPEHCLLHLLKN